jgi:hypothetical protein
MNSNLRKVNAEFLSLLFHVIFFCGFTAVVDLFFGGLDISEVKNYRQVENRFSNFVVELEMIFRDVNWLLWMFNLIRLVFLFGLLSDEGNEIVERKAN